jgi:intracellular sulfur oxidation DsrE/DsrF family protein
MKRIYILITLLALFTSNKTNGQNADSSFKAIQHQKDSVLGAWLHADSVKADKQFKDAFKMEKFKSVFIYPVIRGGDRSGIIPVKDPTEKPDPTIDYKLLFELVENNPDSLSNEINFGLTEVARVINLHVASGIPINKIFPVIVVHGPGLNMLLNNDTYKLHFKTDNPNIKLINDLSALHTKIIACGQAMYFLEIKKEDLLPNIKVSLTAQTVLSEYRLKGYAEFK